MGARLVGPLGGACQLAAATESRRRSRSSAQRGRLGDIAKERGRARASQPTGGACQLGAATEAVGKQKQLGAQFIGSSAKDRRRVRVSGPEGGACQLAPGRRRRGRSGGSGGGSRGGGGKKRKRGAGPGPPARNVAGDPQIALPTTSIDFLVSYATHSASRMPDWLEQM